MKNKLDSTLENEKVEATSNKIEDLKTNEETCNVSEVEQIAENSKLNDEEKLEIDEENFEEDDEDDTIERTKTSLWVYAVVIFTSAFIVLLVTYISQNKYKNNILEYREKLSMNENEKSKVKLDLSSALAENEKLNEENSKLEEENNKIKKDLKEIAEKVQNDKGENSTSFLIHEQILAAYQDMIKEDYISSAIKLKYDIKPEYLGEFGKSFYNELVSKVYKKAAKQLFNDGYKLYKNSEYITAKTKFKQSFEFEDKEYYSDDSYYYYSMCSYLLKDFDDAKNYLNIMLQKYPNSTLKNEAKNLLSKIENS